MSCAFNNLILRDESKRYAGSGLPRGPFFGEQFIATESGFKLCFCEWAEMAPKVGFGVQKRVKSGSKTTFDPL